MALYDGASAAPHVYGYPSPAALQSAVTPLYMRPVADAIDQLRSALLNSQTNAHPLALAASPPAFHLSEPAGLSPAAALILRLASGIHPSVFNPVATHRPVMDQPAYDDSGQVFLGRPFMPVASHRPVMDAAS